MFRLAAAPDSHVFLAGTFNDWCPDEHPMTWDPDAAMYTTSLLLAPGRYEYKFVINDVWCVDPDCLEWTANAKGSLNSVLFVE
jgi:1,4-alpha-glucan branching enzyme